LWTVVVNRRHLFLRGARAAGGAGALTLAACAPGAALPPPAATSAPAAPTPALRPPLTYVALGASDAAGVGVEDPQRDSWVAVLARLLPQPTQLVNLGIPGVRLDEAIEVELPPALEAKPDLVTIWLVVNDLLAGVPLDQYAVHLDRLLRELRTGTTARVAIGNVPNAPDSLRYLGMPAAERRAPAEGWNAAIAAAARAHGATLVDLNRRWPLAQHPEYLGPDRLHPTVAGYRTLAETFLEVLRDERIV
jgi:lysophospholipase L1-like esterase